MDASHSHSNFDNLKTIERIICEKSALEIVHELQDRSYRVSTASKWNVVLQIIAESANFHCCNCQTLLNREL